MAGTFPRRQAARLGGLLSEHFVPGLTCLEAPPRRGKSDFLRQLFGALLTQRAVAPVLLNLGSRRLPDGAAEQAAAQILAFTEGRLRSPAVFLDRARLAERDDGAVWHEFLTACGGSTSPENFFAAAAMLAEAVGPACLLLDDAPEDCLNAAVSLAPSALAVFAAPCSSRLPDAAHVLPLEEFAVREGILLAEGLARALGVDFSGQAAEPFVAYIGSDPFVLQAVMRGAAAAGVALDNTAAFVRTYLDQLSHGTLAAYLRCHLPGEPGSPERRFALETLVAGTLEPARLARWRFRFPVDKVLELMRHGGWVVTRGAEWVLRPWPAARDWAVLETAHAAADRAAGTLTLRLFADLETAGRSYASAQASSRVVGGLRALTPAAAAWLAENGVLRAQVPEIYHVVREGFRGGDLFLCYGFADGRRRPESAALVAVAIPGDSAQLPVALDELNQRAKAAAPRLAGGGSPLLEKWLVLRNPGPPDLEMAQRAGVRLLEFAIFNRLITAVPQAASATLPSEVVLRLPMNSDYEIAAVRVLDHVLERHNCDKRAAAQARIALVEACLNAIEHGRAAQLDAVAAQIEVRLSATDKEVEMTVSNPGPPFQLETGEDADGAGLHRGHGLKIIRSLMDRVSLSSDLNGATIRMSKRFSTVRASAGAESSDDEKTATGIQRD